MSRQPSQRPEKQFRMGYVSASVFTNSAENGRVFRNVQLQRSYRDGDEWKSNASFSLNDLPTAIRVLELALQYVEKAEAEVTT